jgi:hypothetical protein
MKKYLLTTILFITAVGHCDNYYIVSGDAALEIYEREENKKELQKQAWRDYFNNRQIQRKEAEVQKSVDRYDNL